MRAGALKRGIHNPYGPLSCVGVCFSACLTSRKRPPRWGSNHPPCRLCPVRDCRFALRTKAFWHLIAGKLSQMGLHRRRKPVSRILTDPKRFEPKPVMPSCKGCRGQERRKRRCQAVWIFGSGRAGIGFIATGGTLCPCQPERARGQSGKTRTGRHAE